MKHLLTLLLLTLTLTSCYKDDTLSNPCEQLCGTVLDKRQELVYDGTSFNYMYFLICQSEGCSYAKEISVSSTDYFINQEGDYYCWW